jgi:hypothetical protein
MMLIVSEQNFFELIFSGKNELVLKNFEKFLEIFF